MSAAALEIQPTEHISATGLTSYLRCPMSYYYRYIQRSPPTFRPGNLAFGSAIHSALALHYARLMRGMEEPTTEELTAVFVDAWNRELDVEIPVLFEGNDSPDYLKDRGITMLHVFHERAPRPHRVHAVEESFRVELHSPDTGEVLPTLVGKIDALVEDADGTKKVLEHKTAAKRFSEAKLANDLQATTYSLALRMMGVDAGVTFQVLTKTKSPVLNIHDVRRNQQDHRELLETIHGVHRAIESGAFYPVRDWWCRGCAFAGSCIAG